MKLKINNKELEFNFGLGFLGELIEVTGQSLDDVLVKIDKNPYKYIPLAMYCSTKFAYESKGKELDFTKFEFIEWIDKDGGLTDKNESAIKFLQEFQNSLFKDVPKEDEPKEAKETPKKK